MIKVLMVCLILAVPMLALCFAGELFFSKDLTQYLFLSEFSMGNMGQSLGGWIEFPLSNVKISEKDLDISMDCQKISNYKNETIGMHYKLVTVNTFGVSDYLISNDTENHMEDIRLLDLNDDLSCKEFTSYFLKSFDEDCFNRNKCVIPLDVPNERCMQFLSDIISSRKDKEVYMVINFKCIWAHDILFFDKVDTRKAFISYSWVLWDCLIVLMISFCFYKLNKYIRKETSRIKKTRMTADYFTVQCRNLPDLNPVDLYGEIFNFFESLSPKTQVADIGMGMGDKLLSINFQIGRIKRRLLLVEKKMSQDSMSDGPDKKSIIEELEKEHEQLSNQIKDLQQKQDSMEASKLSKVVVKTVFVTFMKEEGAEFVVHHFTKFANSIKLFRLFRKKKIQHF